MKKTKPVLIFEKIENSENKFNIFKNRDSEKIKLGYIEFTETGLSCTISEDLLHSEMESLSQFISEKFVKP